MGSDHQKNGGQKDLDINQTGGQKDLWNIQLVQNIIFLDFKKNRGQPDL